MCCHFCVLVGANERIICTTLSSNNLDPRGRLVFLEGMLVFTSVLVCDTVQVDFTTVSETRPVTSGILAELISEIFLSLNRNASSFDRNMMY